MDDLNRPAAKPTIRKAECSKCGGTRNCDIRGEHTDGYSDKHSWGQTVWYILECRGCENVFVETVATNSEDYSFDYAYDGSDDAIMIMDETVRYWPSLSQRKKPEWMSENGIDAQNVDALDAALIELYGALDTDLRMLAAIGIRTAYDIASELLGIEPTLGFAEKLDALVEGNHIGPLDKDRLETMVDAGSASVHRGWRPEPADLKTMMDVLEHFIHEAFVAPARRKKLNEEAAKVKGTVPPKPPRTRKRTVTGKASAKPAGAMR